MSTVVDFVPYIPTENQVSQAIDIANKKAPYINQNAPNGTKRSMARIKTNIFFGAIAQFAVISVLEKYLTPNVEMYDLIRTDNFQHHDPWDLAIEIDGKKFSVEVRSSYVEKKCSSITNHEEVLDCIAREYNLIASYSTSYKPDELPKALFFQVYWSITQLQAEQIHSRIEANNNYSVTCFVVGFATPKLVSEKGRTSSLGQSGATFKLVSIPLTFPVHRLGELSSKT